MHSKEYWNLMRAKYAFKVQRESEVLAIIGMNRDSICEKMRNEARAVKKNLYIGSYLTKDCFIDLMNDSDFSVRKWSVKLKKPGIFDSGWNFYIEGWHLSYRKYA